MKQEVTPPQDAMLDDVRFKFLAAHNAENVKHGGSSLMRHLTAVQGLLIEWGGREALADAGLFHSVYGTESFTSSILALELRNSVSEVIGPEAEELAYIFGAMEKGSFDHCVLTGPPFLILDRHTATEVSLNERQWRDLCEMVVANWMEQHPRVDSKYKLHKASMFQAVLPFLSLPARRTLESAYGFKSA
jgi:hypothetical protein